MNLEVCPFKSENPDIRIFGLDTVGMGFLGIHSRVSKTVSLGQVDLK